MNENDEIVKEFLVESHENLDRLDRDLVALEKQPSDRETLASIFRTIHTLKGTSGFLAFGKLEAVAHVGENLLAKLRDGQLSLHPELTTALLAMVDAVRQMLASIETSGNEGERDDQELILTLTGLLQGNTEPGGAAGEALAREITAAAEKQAADTEPVAAAADTAANAEAQPLGDILVSRGEATQAQVFEAVAQQQAGDPRHVGEILVDQGIVKPQEVLEALKTQQPHGPASESTIRVDVGLLDKLMNLVGELVLARNQILQFTKKTEETDLVTAGQRLNLIASELQESVMKTRMQPIGNVWSRFPRTVRDLALACGKQVRIQMEGQETELDKTLIEAIKDPLTHLVRNAIDHGIEAPEARQAAGKSAEGVLLLRAFHEGGKVNIEISDDGAGLNLQKVVGKAVQKGLITAEQASRLSEREIANLIFEAGLSTAEKVTNVSG
ncbi:MAG: Hpt domain-containing protein, partial [Terriglobales bacterium]